MTQMEKTVGAIAQLPPNIRLGEGSHTERRASIGSTGDVLGEVEFRPGEHSVGDINPNSMLGEVFGRPHVRQVEQGRPVNIRLIVDAFRNQEHPAVTKSKMDAARGIALLLSQGIRETTDRLQVFGVGQEVADMLQEVRPSTIRDEGELIELASRGLAIIVSDSFNQLREQPNSSFVPIVGIKVNHPAERYVPAGVGLYPLGGWFEVDTDQPEEVDYVNSQLEAEHRRITTELELTGATVASVMSQANASFGFDVPKADTHIAEAIRRLT